MKLWKSSLSSRDNGLFFPVKNVLQENLEIHFFEIVLISSDIEVPKMSPILTKTSLFTSQPITVAGLLYEMASS